MVAQTVWQVCLWMAALGHFSSRAGHGCFSSGLRTGEAVCLCSWYCIIFLYVKCSLLSAHMKVICLLNKPWRNLTLWVRWAPVAWCLSCIVILCAKQSLTVGGEGLVSISLACFLKVYFILNSCLHACEHHTYTCACRGQRCGTRRAGGSGECELPCRCSQLLSHLSECKWWRSV